MDNIRQRTERPSPRALQIMQLMADGMTRVEVARHLHITESTVRTHLAQVFYLLRAHTAAHAIAIAIGEGLITAPARPPKPKPLDW